MNAVIEVLAMVMFIIVLLFSCGTLTAGIWMIIRSAMKSIKNKYDA